MEKFYIIYKSEIGTLKKETNSRQGAGTKRHSSTKIS